MHSIQHAKDRLSLAVPRAFWQTIKGAVQSWEDIITNNQVRPLVPSMK
ncbi:MAG: hypothetical protein P4M11_09330 [Candidatus Pacebacteria bacterium]|nr:hypothetical protein [Candidatus Paceibacterota bacterium]